MPLKFAIFICFLLLIDDTNAQSNEKEEIFLAELLVKMQIFTHHFRHNLNANNEEKTLIDTIHGNMGEMHLFMENKWSLRKQGNMCLRHFGSFASYTSRSALEFVTMMFEEVESTCKQVKSEENEIEKLRICLLAARIFYGPLKHIQLKAGKIYNEFVGKWLTLEKNKVPMGMPEFLVKSEILTGNFEDWDVSKLNEKEIENELLKYKNSFYMPLSIQQNIFMHLNLKDKFPHRNPKFNLVEEYKVKMRLEMQTMISMLYVRVAGLAVKLFEQAKVKLLKNDENFDQKTFKLITNKNSAKTVTEYLYYLINSANEYFRNGRINFYKSEEEKKHMKAIDDDGILLRKKNIKLSDKFIAQKESEYYGRIEKEFGGNVEGNVVQALMNLT